MVVQKFEIVGVTWIGAAYNEGWGLKMGARQNKRPAPREGIYHVPRIQYMQYSVLYRTLGPHAFPRPAALVAGEASTVSLPKQHRLGVGTWQCFQTWSKYNYYVLYTQKSSAGQLWYGERAECAVVSLVVVATLSSSAHSFSPSASTSSSSAGMSC